MNRRQFLVFITTPFLASLAACKPKSKPPPTVPFVPEEPELKWGQFKKTGPDEYTIEGTLYAKMATAPRMAMGIIKEI